MTTTIIAYSGHAYVVIDILSASLHKVDSYCDNMEKINNPYNLEYLGSEKNVSVLSLLKSKNYFIAIGENATRQKVYQSLTKSIQYPINAIHPSSIISPSVSISNGIMIAPNVIINSQAKIGVGVICNTACVIEHECNVADFVHIAPGATLAGNVTIGLRTFIGANAVVKQGVSIGKDVTVGAGSVIIHDIPDNSTVVGNPGRIIKKS